MSQSRENRTPSQTMQELVARIAELEAKAVPRPLDDWHEDFGPMLWWTFPIQEEPYCGTPNDSDWPGYHTHWTPIPIPEDPR
jgi:hypothetical protein